MGEITIYPSGAWGQQLPSGQQPEGQLAELEAERKATPQRVAQARRLFEEASMDEFEPYGSTGRKLRHRESGEVFVVADDQVLMAADPRKSGIEFFVVAGDRIYFLRPRGWNGNVEVGVPGEILSGVLEQSPSGGVRVRDARSGVIVRDGLKL